MTHATAWREGAVGPVPGGVNIGVIAPVPFLSAAQDDAVIDETIEALPS